jgi:hypothetical protein
MALWRRFTITQLRTPMLPKLIGFGLFELNLGTRHLHTHGRSVQPQEQPLRAREPRLEHPGERVTRERLGFPARGVAWRRMALPSCSAGVLQTDVYTLALMVR